MNHSEKIRNKSYAEILADPVALSKSQMRVFASVDKSKGATLREISQKIGMDIHLVSARMSELRQAGLVTDTAEVRTSEVTGKQNTVFKISAELTADKQLTIL